MSGITGLAQSAKREPRWLPHRYAHLLTLRSCVYPHAEPWTPRFAAS